MNVTTKTGDSGQTGLFNQRVEKDHPLVALLGAIDEVMAYFILIQAEYPAHFVAFKARVDELILMSAIVAGYKEEAEFKVELYEYLEHEIALIADDCHDFIYPFNDPMRAKLNVLRTKVRAMERSMIQAFKATRDFKVLRIYTNRLSDYVFILINKKY